MRCLSKGSESWRRHTYWKIHRFQEPTQPKPNYRSEKLKQNLQKVTQVHSALFFSVLSILYSNNYWLSPSYYGMWRTFLSWHKTVRQLIGLGCICWTCAADFSSRYLIKQAAYLFTCSSVWNFKILLSELLTYIHTAPLLWVCCAPFQTTWLELSTKVLSLYPWKEIMILFLASAVLITVSPPPNSNLDRGSFVQ